MKSVQKLHKTALHVLERAFKSVVSSEGNARRLENLDKRAESSESMKRISDIRKKIHPHK